MGDEAHIAAKSPGGPRYGECAPDKVDDYDNLVLLCREDHKRVDDQPGEFTSEKLRRIKSAHEKWVADTLATSSNRSDSRLDLSSIRVTDTSGETDSSAVLDLMVRNIGDQPAIIHRAVIHIRDALNLSPYHVVGLLPYEEMWVRGALGVSHKYHLDLPYPHEARDTHYELELSQIIDPAGGDRFHIRLGTPPSQDTLVYLLDLDVFYDKHGVLSSPALAVAHPSGTTLVTYDELCKDINAFERAVDRVRDAVNQEMAALDMRMPDWDNHPPAARTDLPPGLRSLDGDPHDPLGLRPGTYKVNDTFWDPKAALARQRRRVHAFYEHVVRIISNANVSHRSLSSILAQAQAVLAQLPPPNEHDSAQ